MITTEGRPYDGTEIRILGADDAPLPTGEVEPWSSTGQAGSCRFLGNDDLTRDSLTGWGGYRTGDLGYLDEDGHLVYVGRSKDIIRRGGVTVVPAELRPCSCAASGPRRGRRPLPDERLDERACAALVLKPGQRAHPGRAAGVPRSRGRGQVHVARVRRDLRRVPRTPSLKVVKGDVVRQILEARAFRPEAVAAVTLGAALSAAETLVRCGEMSSDQHQSDPNGPARAADVPRVEGAKRTEILAAATERFGRNGYEDTKWADIASDVGVGPTALYHYFESKQHCLYVIMDQAIEGFGRASSC
jgi:acyl-CoA synthetase (AMP-forming)/AMP-acid ligase II